MPGRRIWPLALAAGPVALWAKFVPCSLWIFLAAPCLDRLSDRPRLSAALWAIAAAMVGVVLNLTIWFAMHVFLDNIAGQSIGPQSLSLPDILSVNLPALALIRLRLGMAATLALAALARSVSHLV